MNYEHKHKYTVDINVILLVINNDIVLYKCKYYEKKQVYINKNNLFLFNYSYIPSLEVIISIKRLIQIDTT